MDLSIVIVNYNVKGFLEQALRTLIDASEGIEVEIFVVDNGSSDGSTEMVESLFPQVHLIRNENVGFAGGNNVALRQCQGNYVLLINPDTVVLPDTLRVMMRFLDEHPEAGAAGCKLLNPDGTLQLACRRGFPTPVAAFSKILGLSALFPKSRIFGAYNLTYLDPHEVHEVDALSGSFMMVRREILDSVGLLDERFFMNGEDLDWCYRIKKAGWRIYYVPDTEIIHFKGESKKLVSRYKDLLWFYHSMHLFVTKHRYEEYRFCPVQLLTVGIALSGTMALIAKMIVKLRMYLLDCGLVALGLTLAIRARFHLPLPWHQHTLIPLYSTREWVMIYLIFIGVWLLCFYLLGLYDRNRFSPWRALLAACLGLIGSSSLTSFAKGYAFSRLVALYAWGLNSVFLVGWRWIFQMISKAHVARMGYKRTLIVGTGAEGVRFLRMVNDHPHWAHDVVGFVDFDREMRGKEIEGKGVLGVVDDLPEIVRTYHIDEVIVTTPTMLYSEMLGLVSKFRRGPQLKLLPASLEAANGELPLIDIAYRPLRQWRRLLNRKHG